MTSRLTRRGVIGLAATLAANQALAAPVGPRRAALLSGRRLTADQAFVAALGSNVIGAWIADTYSATPRPYIPNLASTAAAPKNLLAAPRRLFSSSNAGWITSGTITVTDIAATGPDGLTEASTVNLSSNALLKPGSTIVLPAGTYTLSVDGKRNAGTDQTCHIGFQGISNTAATYDANWGTKSHTITLAVQTTVTPIVCWALSGAANVQICDARLHVGAVDLGPDVCGGHIILGDTFNSNTGSYANGALDCSSGGFGLCQFSGSPASASFTAMAVLSKVATGTNYQAAFTDAHNYLNLATFVESLPAALNIGPATQFSGSGTVNSQFPGAPQTMLSDGYHVYMWRYDVATQLREVWIDGILFNSYTDSALSSKSFADLFMGAVINRTLYMGYKFAGAALWTRAISDAEMKTACNAIITRIATNIAVARPSRWHIFEGDSITGGYSTATAYGVISAASPKIYGSVRAISGSGIATLNARKASVLREIASAQAMGAHVTVSVLISANDLTSAYSNNAANYAAALALWADAIRATGAPLIVCTALPRTTTIGSGVADTAFNTARNSLNTILRTWVGVHCDAIADFGADATMGPDAACIDTSLYRDGWHPTDATGFPILAGLLTTAVNAS